MRPVCRRNSTITYAAYEVSNAKLNAFHEKIMLFDLQRCRRLRNRWWKPLPMCTNHNGQVLMHWMHKHNKSRQCGKTSRINWATKCSSRWTHTRLNSRKWRFVPAPLIAGPDWSSESYSSLPTFWLQKKIEKRNRKLIDYDGQRHSFQSLQASAAKRKDDVKVTKGREQLEEARRTYEILNTELHDELPALYDSRILFLVTNLQTLFASEQVFHNETQKVMDPEQKPHAQMNLTVFFRRFMPN